MPYKLDQIDPNTSRVPLMGISEWAGYYGHFGLALPDDPVTAIDKCIDDHLAIGFDQIVWDCGRSTLNYWSDLPNTTRSLERCGKDAIPEVWRALHTVLGKTCPLRRAIKVCRERNMPILGRLCMQRHYGSPGSEGDTSRFAAENPQLHEINKNGKMSLDKLCYAFDEVQQERIDILLEIQRTGVDALLLDWCRQTPILKYHPALVDPYIKKTGVDPRKIDTSNPDDYKEWFQYRADVLTGFVRKLRLAVRQQEKKLGRACPIVARIPDSAPWVTTAFGLDMDQWFKEDLVDATMLSPFPLCIEDPGYYPEYHISMAHKYGKVCIGGVGSSSLLVEFPKEAKDYHPKPVCQKAHRQYEAGADAMSVYQTDVLIHMPYLQDLIREIADRTTVARRCQELPDPERPEQMSCGNDWHTYVRHSLQISRSRSDGKDAL